MMAVQLTQRERIILAAFTVWKGESAVTISDEKLVVAAWTLFPAAFGLKNYAERYPDANKVRCYVMGQKGLIAQGLLSRVGTSAAPLYALTEMGRVEAMEIQRRAEA